MKRLCIFLIIFFLISCTKITETDLEFIPSDSDSMLSLDIPKLLNNRTVNFILERKGIKRILERKMQLYLEDIDSIVVSQKISFNLFSNPENVIILKYKKNINNITNNLKKKTIYKNYKIYSSDKKGISELFIKNRRILAKSDDIKDIINNISKENDKTNFKLKDNANRIFKAIDDYPIRIFLNLNSALISGFLKGVFQQANLTISGYVGVSVDITNDSLKFHILLISDTLPLNNFKNKLENDIDSFQNQLKHLSMFSQKFKLEIDNIVKSIKVKKENNKLDIRIDISHRFLGSKVNK